MKKWFVFGWTILWIDEQDQIIWQVALEKYTGHVLERNETKVSSFVNGQL